MKPNIMWPIIFLLAFSGTLRSQEEADIEKTVRILFVDEQGNSLRNLHVVCRSAGIDSDNPFPRRVMVHAGGDRNSSDAFKEAARNEDGTFHLTLHFRSLGKPFFHVLSAQTEDKRLGVIFHLPRDPGKESISVTLTPVPKATMKVVSSVDGSPLLNTKLTDFRLCFECAWRDDCFTPFHTSAPWGPRGLETDEDGVVTFDDLLPGGVYELQYARWGSGGPGVAWRTEVKQEDTEIDLGIIDYYPGSGQSPGFEALVLDEKENPVSDATVSVAQKGNEIWHGKTDKNGLVKGFLKSFHDSNRNYLDPATLMARSPDGTAAQTQTLRRSEPEVTIRLRPPVSVTGRIIDKESGKPIPNVPVLFRGTGWTQVQYRNGNFATTDEQGFFRYDKIIPGDKFRFQLHKVIAETDSECRIPMEPFYDREAGVGESLDLGVFERNASQWRITADDRFYEAVLMEKKIPRLDRRLEEMCERATKNGRNVLLHLYSFGAQNPHLNTLSHLAGKGRDLSGLFDSFEFVTLHTPQGFSPESRTFQGLQAITGQELRPDVFVIVFSADGTFLGMCDIDGVDYPLYDKDGKVVGWTRNSENLGRFLEKFGNLHHP